MTADVVAGMWVTFAVGWVVWQALRAPYDLPPGNERIERLRRLRRG